jgi:hypothetical protein
MDMNKTKIIYKLTKLTLETLIYLLKLTEYEPVFGSCTN